MWERVSRAGDAGERAAHDAARTVACGEPATVPENLNIEAVVAPALQAPGTPLDPVDRAWAEHRFGFDFSRVRIHVDGRADVSARRLDAAAYTAGDHIVFAAGRYRPGQALIAHELAHVAGGERGVIHRSGPLGFLSDIFTEGPGQAFARLFGEGDFSPETLTAYLNKLRAQQRVEGDYDSDNKARAITRLWVAGDRRFQLDRQLKSLLVREMWEGDTSEADAKAILDIMERSLDPDLLAILTIGGVPPKELHESFGKAERRRLEALLDGRFKGGAAAVLKGAVLEFIGGPSAPTNLNDETFRLKWERALADAVDKMRKAMVTDPRTCNFPPSSPHPPRFDDDKWVHDPLALNQQKQLVDGTRGSFVPKEGTPWEAVKSLLDNLNRWECDCLFATQVAQLFAWHAVLTPEAFNAKFAGFRTGAGKGSETVGLESDLVTVAEQTTQEDLDAALPRSPVGTVVVWLNTAEDAKGTAFHHEHVIKIEHKGTGEGDRYAAHGYGTATFGDPLTADQIRFFLAEINIDFPFRYVIDLNTIEDLRADNCSPAVVAELEQHLLFEAASWAEFIELKPVKDLMELTNPEAKPHQAKVRKWAKRPPLDKQAARAYVDKTIVLERIEIPK